ncbi:hypothetical protein WJX72_010937 [[Myrmecia] bisecta]|uniref:Nodulin homeobox N-terminal domain-containing protein n=1 Tax=[Myrmecia] bisecta TaxID=41462 RepID=A0AAW1PTU3_9CHLO
MESHKIHGLSERQVRLARHEAAVREHSKILDVFKCVERLYATTLTARSVKHNNTLQISRHSYQGGIKDSVDVERLTNALPLHLLACLLAQQPSGDAEGGWAEEVTPTELTPTHWAEYQARGLGLLGKLCQLAEQTPALRSRLEQDQIVDLVTMVLLTMAGPEAEASVVAAAEGAPRIQEALRRAALVQAALETLICGLQPSADLGLMRVSWQGLCKRLFAHPRLPLFLDAAFDAVRTLLRMVRAALLPSPQQATPKQIYDLATYAGISMEYLASLCACPLFYYRMVLHDASCAAPLRLIVSGLQLHDPPLAPSPVRDPQLTSTASAKGSSELLSARSMALLLMLCQYDETPFLDQVGSAEHPESRRLCKAATERILEYAGGVLTRPPVADVPVALVGEGQMSINALHMTETLADDGNVRKTAMEWLAAPLAQLLLMEREAFQSAWCGGEETVAQHANDFINGHPFPISSISATAISRAEGVRQIAVGFGLVSGYPQTSRQSPAHKAHKEQHHVCLMALERSIALYRCLGTLDYYNADVSDPELQDYFAKLLVNAVQSSAYAKAHGGAAMQRVIERLRDLQAFMERVLQVASSELSPEVVYSILPDEETDLWPAICIK